MTLPGDTGSEHADGNRAKSATFVPIIIGLLALRVVILVASIRAGDQGPVTDDLARFREIAEAPGVPYRDFPVEYAPGELLVVRMLGSDDLSAVATRVAAAAFLADIATCMALWRGWGLKVVERYLWIGTPLLLFIYARFDLVPVAIITWALVLALERRERIGGLTAAAGILTKVWPAVLIPVFVITRRKSALVWCLVSTAVAGALWVAFAGVAGIADVLTFRHASGWEIESFVGTFVWILGGGSLVQEAGAPRVGTVPEWASIVLGLVLAASLVTIWWTAARRRTAAFGAASAAALGAVLVCSPVFSLQYVAWLLPWAAIAWVEEDDRWAFGTVAAISALTGALFIVYAPDRVGVSQALLVCRNGLTLSLPVVWLIRGRRRPNGALITSHPRSAELQG